MPVVILSWPNPVLSPNARPNRMAKARSTKKAREEAFYSARAAGVYRAGPQETATGISLRFLLCRPNVQIDKDNAIASCKAFLDGIADALGVRDNLLEVDWSLGPVEKPGAVIVDVTGRRRA